MTLPSFTITLLSRWCSNYLFPYCNDCTYLFPGQMFITINLVLFLGWAHSSSLVISSIQISSSSSIGHHPVLFTQLLSSHLEYCPCCDNIFLIFYFPIILKGLPYVMHYNTLPRCLFSHHHDSGDAFLSLHDTWVFNLMLWYASSCQSWS